MERAESRLLSFADPTRPRALIVDDDPVGRIALRKLLDRCGFDSLLASNGAEGVERFLANRPDLVFMDLMMPVMDGLDATLRIKQLCGDTFVPVIFVTGASDEEDIARCIEAGGDDFLVKPYSHTVLAAKINAMERIRALHRRTRGLHDHMRAEQDIAKRILEHAVMGPNARPPGLRSLLAPAATFNGDILLSAHAPTGDLHVLLGDFTGHGLAATIGALPTAETFRAMTAKGFAPTAILAEINSKLRALLPTGLFLAAVFLRVGHDLRHASIVNCGMPDALLVAGGAVEASVSSGALPLAVSGDENFAAAEHLLMVPEQARIVLLSDGAIEVGDASGAMLGIERLRLAIAAGAAQGDAIGAARAAIDAFRAGMVAADDVSLVEVELSSAILDRVAAPGATAAVPPPRTAAAATSGEDGGWRLSLELRGRLLREASPVPMLLSLLQEFKGTEPHAGPLFTILSELYNNALDHGVLGMDSTLKRAHFADYLSVRERRLGSVGSGRVSIELDCTDSPGRDRLAIRVEDSGPGFDAAATPPPRDDAPHGRGIHLVRALCQSLVYDRTGTHACAVYDLYAGPTMEENDAHPDRR